MATTTSTRERRRRRRFRAQPRLGVGIRRDYRFSAVVHAVDAAIDAEAKEYGVSPSWVSAQRLAASYGLFDEKGSKYDYRKANGSK